MPPITLKVLLFDDCLLDSEATLLFNQHGITLDITRETPEELSRNERYIVSDRGLRLAEETATTLWDAIFVGNNEGTGLPKVRKIAPWQLSRTRVLWSRFPAENAKLYADIGITHLGLRMDIRDFIRDIAMATRAKDLPDAKVCTIIHLPDQDYQRLMGADTDALRPMGKEGHMALMTSGRSGSRIIVYPSLSRDVVMRACGSNAISYDLETNDPRMPFSFNLADMLV